MFNMHFVKNIIYRDFVISLKEKEKKETTRAVEKMSRQNLERIKINCEILNKKNMYNSTLHILSDQSSVIISILLYHIIKT